MLDVPVAHFSHDKLAGLLPIVPAGQAVNPDGSVASILDPSGTKTAVDPSPATTFPFATAMHFLALGFGW